MSIPDEKVFQKILDASDRIIHVSDIETHEIVYVNAVGRRFAKDSAENYIGKKCYEYFWNRTEKCPCCMSHTANLDENKVFERYEQVGDMYIQTRYENFTWNDRKLYIEYITDVTAQKKLQIELEDQKKKTEITKNEFLRILSGVPTGIAQTEIINGKPQITYVSLGLCKASGYTEKEIIDNFSDDFTFGAYPDDRENLKSVALNAISKEEMFVVQYRMCKRSGEYIWANLKANPMKTPDGKLVYYCAYTNITANKELELQLLAEKSKMDMVLDNSAISIWEYDIKTKSITWLYKMKGDLRADNPVTKNIPEGLIESGSICDDSIKDYLDIYTEMLAGKGLIRKIIHVKNPSGIEMWQRLNYKVNFVDGKPVSAIGYAVDVSEPLRREKIFKRELKFLEEVHSENLIDKARANLTQNIFESYKSSTGVDYFKSGESYEKSIRQLIDYCVDEKAKDYIGKLLSKENLYREYRNLNKYIQYKYQRNFPENDIPLWVELSVKLYQDPSSDDIIAFLYTYNIDEEMQIQNIMNAIFDNGYSMIGVIDINKRQIKGYQTSKLEKESEIPVSSDYDASLEILINNFVGVESKEEVRNALSLDNILKRLETEKKYSYSFSVYVDGVLHRKSCEVFYLGEDKTKLLCTRSDVTEMFLEQQRQRERLHEALIAANQASVAKTTFLSNMSHDIRTPLNVIINMTKITRDDYKGLTEGNVLSDLDKIETSGEFLSGLVNNILDMSKIESGRMELRPEVYMYYEFTNYISCIFEPLCENKQIEFIVNKSSTDYAIVVDKLRFNQLFFNILSNAVKYTPNGGTVSFKIYDNKTVDGFVKCKFEIKDTGVGMSKEFQKKMFEPFEREDDYNQNVVGTGLGLSIVKHIIDLMNGKISVESEKGKGTTFTVELTLPIATDKQLVEQENGASIRNTYEEILKGKNILVVEDNPLNRTVLERLLTSKGCIYYEAPNGKEALETFVSNKPYTFDCILMDIRMPVMDGLMASKAIRELEREDAKKIPIIAMTANAFDDDRENSRNAGMNDHLTKPVNPTLMFKTIMKYMK